MNASKSYIANKQQSQVSCKCESDLSAWALVCEHRERITTSNSSGVGTVGYMLTYVQACHAGRRSVGGEVRVSKRSARQGSGVSMHRNRWRTRNQGCACRLRRGCLRATDAGTSSAPRSGPASHDHRTAADHGAGAAMAAAGGGDAGSARAPASTRSVGRASGRRAVRRISAAGCLYGRVSSCCDVDITRGRT
ncbi:hypothetical protein BV25DRAFT_795377 [Artomyces pyxidatus]|uniref:Uncharacterized protein n=1 Tax=Artomyces pyxidatus TaxID=48021 RepID=A0ACB8SY21_9AGAM|nr:hypothetical protein BV25DRAFT_795377 [Artomyces pyxidatus]